jgi:hypothetical protein
MRYYQSLRLASAFSVFLTTASIADAVQVLVTIENLTSNSVAITPLWVGFHDGSFDSYNSGLSAQPGVERLAEDGNTSAISSDFLGGLT